MKRITAVTLILGVLLGSLTLVGCSGADDHQAFNDAISSANKQTDKYNKLDGEVEDLSLAYFGALDAADTKSAEDYAKRMVTKIDEQNECLSKSTASLRKIKGDDFTADEKTYAKQQIEINGLTRDINDLIKEYIVKRLDYALALANAKTSAAALGTFEADLQDLETRTADMDTELEKLSDESDAFYRKRLEKAE